MAKIDPHKAMTCNREKNVRARACFVFVGANIRVSCMHAPSVRAKTEILNQVAVCSYPATSLQLKKGRRIDLRYTSKFCI